MIFIADDDVNIYMKMLDPDYDTSINPSDTLPLNAYSFMNIHAVSIKHVNIPETLYLSFVKTSENKYIYTIRLVTKNKAEYIDIHFTNKEHAEIWLEVFSSDFEHLAMDDVKKNMLKDIYKYFIIIERLYFEKYTTESTTILRSCER